VILAASTYTGLWHSDLRSTLAGIARAGIRAVEVMAAPPHLAWWEDERAGAETLGRACDAEGITVSTIVPGGLDVNLASPDADMRALSVRHFEAVARIGAAAGASTLIVHPGRRHPFKPAPLESTEQAVIDAVARIATTARELGIRVAFENAPTGILDLAEDCIRVVEAVGSERVGVCYDVANGFMVEDPAAGLRTVADVLDVVHVSDTFHGRWRHDPIGTGEVDFLGIGAALAELAFDGVLVAETIHRGDLAEGFSQDVARLTAAGLLSSSGNRDR
jgi:sugar phosphate isomerase/epimerase